ncbi:glucose-6-phosphate dehydrogenase [Candidatus Woesebacteria bacterium]|nr:glucose-6-phosphate dehydrogenase [Candidatus Woesebacteria bacterium]
MKNTHTFSLPTIFVIFGITGDLVKKKILKSLYDLYLKQLLPEKFLIYGFSRRRYDDEQLRAYLLEIMNRRIFKEPKQYNAFLSHIHYVQGNFLTISAYEDLALKLGRVDKDWTFCSNKLFYLAVPPVVYPQLINNLHLSGLTKPCSPEEGWTRVILEKPFGTDFESAKALDMQLAKLFKEEQIYRVDHYLAKETVRNILAFRFGNSFLQPAWNKHYIHSISVRLYEKDLVGSRGGFYDKVGALRDVGQNHMLQLLAFFLMDQPKTFTPEEIKKERSKALSSLKLFSAQEVKDNAFRGQYDGYTNEDGVAAHSTIETYFKIRAYSTCPDFVGVPLILESGKGMHQNRTEVVVEFKRPSSNLFDVDKQQNNTLHYLIKPHEKISLDFLAKRPGFSYMLDSHELSFDYHERHRHEEFVDDYEALLYDIIRGDQTLFVSTGEILNQWKFIEPFVETWNKMGIKDLQKYLPGNFEGIE